MERDPRTAFLEGRQERGDTKTENVSNIIWKLEFVVRVLTMAIVLLSTLLRLAKGGIGSGGGIFFLAMLPDVGRTSREEHNEPLLVYAQPSAELTIQSHNIGIFNYITFL